MENADYFYVPYQELLTVMTEQINTAIKVLSRGGLILYPTDTVWAIGCDATDEAAVQKVHELKQHGADKALICLVANDAMLERHIENVPDLAFDIMDLSTKPTTIVYDLAKGVAKNLLAKDRSLAVRVVSDKFCKYLINKFKKPLVSTSANISGEPLPKNFDEISTSILKGVDYVVDLHRDKTNGKPSSIIKLSADGSVKIIRE